MKLKIFILMVVADALMASCLYGQNFTVSLKAFLEGPFTGATMGTWLNNSNYLPLTQPYNTAPWNYQGIEIVPFIPNADVVDWVLVELRETAGDASTAYKDNVVATQAGFVLKNGNIVSIDGNSPLQFSFAVAYKLYAVVYHRNHLAVLSGNELINSGGNYAYDFTTGAGQAYGGANAQKEIISGIWGMIAGDGDANGQVNNADKNDVWKPQSGSSGYKSGDFSLNGQVDNVDKNDLWRVNSGKSSQVVGAWSCGKPFTDFRDGQIYASVQIGSQCWMKQNLNIGNSIPLGINQTNNGILEKYCYHDSIFNCDVYGGLYMWEEMMQYVTTPGVIGICPDGWHLPEDNEVCTLALTVDPTVDCGINIGWRGTDAGTKMKSTTGWYGGGNGTNTSGFTALPGGYRDPSWGGYYQHKSLFMNLWTSSLRVGDVWRWTLSHNESRIYRSFNSVDFSFSVRCIKDLPNLPPAIPSNPDPPDNAANQPMITLLHWSCSDPENDPLWYEVYFGTTNPPGILGTSVTDTTYNPGPLEYNTTYYWKIVAYDDHGHATEGPVWSFTTKAAWECNDPLLDIRDYQTYNTVQIGSQCWMAENLNIGYRINGSDEQTDNGIIERYCYHDSIENCDVYGGLYQWEEMMQYITTPGFQGICPVGWHIPEDGEWCTLAQSVDPTVDCGMTGWIGTDAGDKMKSTTGWYGGGNGTNTSGFSALPGGYRELDSLFKHLTLYANFWTSDGIFYSASRWNMYYDEPRISHYTYSTYIYLGFSVRCLKDVPNLPPAQPSNPDPPDNATNQPAITLLHWSCSDPENDPLLYQVYFGTAYPPPPYGSAGFDTVYNPGPLDYDTTYYWKIVAHDDHGHTTEGPVWSFSTKTGWGCNDPLLDIRDYQTYNTVQIGSQCWMAENLNIGYRINGSDEQTDNGYIEKYCYNDSIENCDVYGGLYQWEEMMQYITTPGTQGICPDAWHIPEDVEYCTLAQLVDPTVDCGAGGWTGTDAGDKMKSTTGWYGGGNGANTSGFTALPGGYVEPGGGYYLHKFHFANYWTSTLNVFGGLRWNMAHSETRIYRWTDPVEYGFSVRCIKDPPNLPPDQPFNPIPLNGSINQPITTQLTWSCTDPENDPLVYDVYFGTSTPPGLLMTSVTDTTFNPGLLEYNTNYYWKIVAYDDHGNMTEGPVWLFATKLWACGEIMVDARDNQAYETKQYDTQCWMVENLNIGTMIPGTSNPSPNGIIEKYCYLDDVANCDTYGGLYQWSEMMQYVPTPGIKGICPEDWHLPTDGDYCILSQFIDPTVNCTITGPSGTDAGYKMKSTSGWYMGGNGSNESGFNALPGGNLLSSGYFYMLGYYSFLWTSSQEGSSAWARSMFWSQNNINRITLGIGGGGFSVRCIRDTVNLPPTVPTDPYPENNSTGHPVIIECTWTSHDPEWDPLTFDVYFDTNNPPAQVTAGQSGNTFNPGLLAYSTVYYWKVVAYDNDGNSTAGPLWTFSTRAGWECGDLMLDLRDNKIYSTAQIGPRCWMTENLNIGTMIPGTSNQTNNGVIEKYCSYDLPEKCEISGGLYQWHEMMQYSTMGGEKGICPDGWHLPTDGDYCALAKYIDPTVNCTSTGWSGTDVGTKMKSTSGWFGGGNGTNSSGFNARPGGARLGDGSFLIPTLNAHFWTSSVSYSYAWYWRLDWDNTGIFRYDDTRYRGQSVRCVKDWQCGDNFLDQRDNQIYKSVQVGTQCWMADNLNIGLMIQNPFSPENNGIIEKFCYDNNAAKCDVYGGLYDWDEMMQYITTPGVQGICPDGWHLPTDEQWCILEQYVDPSITCNSTGFRGIDGGGRLKEAGTEHWMAPNYGATNSSGFTGLPGGILYCCGGGFFGYKIYGNFWSSSANGPNAWLRSLQYYNAQIARGEIDRGFGYSVRCLKY